MGKLCSKQVQTTSSQIESEQEVSICSYKSASDDALKLQENKFNYLSKINLIFCVLEWFLLMVYTFLI